MPQGRGGCCRGKVGVADGKVGAADGETGAADIEEGAADGEGVVARGQEESTSTKFSTFSSHGKPERKKTKPKFQSLIFYKIKIEHVKNGGGEVYQLTDFEFWSSEGLGVVGEPTNQ